MAKEIKFRVKLNIDGKDFDIRNKSRIFANENPMWERGVPLSLGCQSSIVNVALIFQILIEIETLIGNWVFIFPTLFEVSHPRWA